MNISTVHSLLILGAILAVGIFLLSEIIGSHCLPPPTSEPRLNITGHGFRIRKIWFWSSKSAQFKPSQFASRGRIIGREKHSSIRAHSDCDGSTREDFRCLHRKLFELNYDSDKAKFYLKNLSPNNKICWKPLGNNDANLRFFEGERLYLDQSMQILIDSFSLEFELLQSELNGPNFRFNRSLYLAFFAYQLYGLFLLFRSSIGPNDSIHIIAIICLSVFLLATMVYTLFHNCRENYLFKIILSAVLTTTYFVYIISSDNLKVTASWASIVVFSCAALILLLPNRKQIKSNGAYFCMLLIAAIFSIFTAKISFPEVEAFFLAALTLLPLFYI